MSTCPRCTRATAPGDEVCGGCGAPLDAPIAPDFPFEEAPAHPRAAQGPAAAGRDATDPGDGSEGDGFAESTTPIAAPSAGRGRPWVIAGLLGAGAAVVAILLHLAGGTSPSSTATVPAPPAGFDAPAPTAAQACGHIGEILSREGPSLGYLMWTAEGPTNDVALFTGSCASDLEQRLPADPNTRRASLDCIGRASNVAGLVSCGCELATTGPDTARCRRCAGQTECALSALETAQRALVFLARGDVVAAQPLLLAPEPGSEAPGWLGAVEGLASLSDEAALRFERTRPAVTTHAARLLRLLAGAETRSSGEHTVFAALGVPFLDVVQVAQQWRVAGWPAESQVSDEVARSVIPAVRAEVEAGRVATLDALRTEIAARVAAATAAPDELAASDQAAEVEGAAEPSPTASTAAAPERTGTPAEPSPGSATVESAEAQSSRHCVESPETLAATIRELASGTDPARATALLAAATESNIGGDAVPLNAATLRGTDVFYRDVDGDGMREAALQVIAVRPHDRAPLVTQTYVLAFFRHTDHGYCPVRTFVETYEHCEYKAAQALVFGWRKSDSGFWIDRKRTLRCDDLASWATTRTTYRFNASGIAVEGQTEGAARSVPIATSNAHG